ncbi:hypothetical protein YTPLAS18_19250 [Nitrospira sp.]|nr:hypothetical protein YTPLAS18_19250 [Nitrospira sp.]
MKGDDALWLGMTVWYMIVLALCATAAPDEGFLGMALAVLPPQVYAWSYAPAAGLLTWLLLQCLPAREWVPGGRFALSGVLSLLFVGTLEWAHAWQGERGPIWSHLAWAAFGILFTWFLVWLDSRRMARSASVIPFRAVGRARKGSL